MWRKVSRSVITVPLNTFCIRKQYTLNFQRVLTRGAGRRKMETYIQSNSQSRHRGESM